MTNNDQKKFALQKRRAISPILATVILIGITVVAGGIVFTIFSGSASVASNADVISIQNAQAIKGTGHADFTMTVKNAGSSPWTEVSMTVSKTELSEPIIYESLHENVSGCATGTGLGFDTTTGKCKGTGNGGNEGKPFEGRDNPLRAQWLIALDKESGTDGEADFGEGAAVGRKLVFQDKDDLRDIAILNGTTVAPLFGGNGPDNTTTYSGNIAASCTVGSGWTDCSAVFDQLDKSTDGEIFCKKAVGEGNTFAKCKVFTHTNIRDSPIATGQSVYFYADGFTKEIPGLNNQVLRVGDNVVANVAIETADGGSARVQTVLKVTGL